MMIEERVNLYGKEFRTYRRKKSIWNDFGLYYQKEPDTRSFGSDAAFVRQSRKNHGGWLGGVVLRDAPQSCKESGQQMDALYTAYSQRGRPAYLKNVPAERRLWSGFYGLQDLAENEEKIRMQYSMDHFDGSDDRLQSALHRLLGGGIR